MITNILANPRMLNALIFSRVPTGSGVWSSSSASSGFARSSVGSYSYGRNLPVPGGGVLGESSPGREGYFESEASEKMEPVEEWTETRWVRMLAELAIGGGGVRAAETACC